MTFDVHGFEVEEEERPQGHDPREDSRECTHPLVEGGGFRVQGGELSPCTNQGSENGHSLARERERERERETPTSPPPDPWVGGGRGSRGTIRERTRASAHTPWLRVEGSGFRVQGSGSRVQGSGLRVEG